MRPDLKYLRCWKCGQAVQKMTRDSKRLLGYCPQHVPGWVSIFQKKALQALQRGVAIRQARRRESTILLPSR